MQVGNVIKCRGCFRACCRRACANGRKWVEDKANETEDKTTLRVGRARASVRGCRLLSGSRRWSIARSMFRVLGKQHWEFQGTLQAHAQQDACRLGIMWLAECRHCSCNHKSTERYTMFHRTMRRSLNERDYSCCGESPLVAWRMVELLLSARVFPLYACR